jgi:hypothetical protein
LVHDQQTKTPNHTGRTRQNTPTKTRNGSLLEIAINLVFRTPMGMIFHKDVPAQPKRPMNSIKKVAARWM